MVWLSRADKLPPPWYLSMIAAYLADAYKGAVISRELMATLQPYFVEAWRNGKGPQAAAQTTCSCNGREIVPSPVVGVQIARGSVRPPKGAVRGQVFGVDELRAPAPIERLEKRLSRVAREQSKQQTVAAKWQHREQTSRKESVRDAALRNKGKAASRYDELLREAQKIQGEIQRTRNELSQTRQRRAATPALLSPSAQELMPTTSTPTQNIPMPTPATAAPQLPTAAQSVVGMPKAPGRRGRKPGAQQMAQPTDAQSAAMFSALQGLLPGVASQLAAQMAKDEAAES